MAVGINVTNAANYINISDPSNVNIMTIKKTAIASVGMYFQKNCVNGLGQSPYAYGRRTPGRTTKTIIQINLTDRTHYSFDCDEVINQATWQGCTNTELLVAHADIVSWL